MDEPEFTNRLIKEKSPYLLQHAHNPVDWYPWGDEAFNAAKERDVPIFLSIGYATCHWCHVMERECFDDIEIAMALNDAFVCIKVDREELPEVDALYMEFAQTMIIGAAGWPLNLILTPDLKPFFAATYIPKHSTRGLVGLPELIGKISELWKGEDKVRLIAQSEKITEILQSHVQMTGTDLPHPELIKDAEEVLFRIADPIYGGMRGAPKFPLGYQANFLLRRYLIGQDSRALFLVELTLDMMHRGGIYDHIGGGFSRYSVDEKWLVPHFEKMLYDNALLAYAYLEVYRVTRRPLYKEVLEHILDYVLRDMRDSEGGFYCAEDAESEGVEGLFYTWTQQQIIEALGSDVGGLVAGYYGVEEEGNFEGRSVLNIPLPDEEFAKTCQLDLLEWKQMLADAKKELFEARQRRTRPFRDTKILTCWNGLMIRALAEASLILSEERYLQAAISCARFIKEKMWKEGQLYRRYAAGEVGHHASLEDFSYLISGVLSLFEASGDLEWLKWIFDLTTCLEKYFKELSGAFYQADDSDSHLIIKKTQFSDGAEPSGNAVHAENLLRIYQLTADPQYLEQAEDIFRAVKHFAESYPLGYCYSLTALMRYYDKKKALILLVLGSNHELLPRVRALVSQYAVLHHIFIVKKDDEIASLIPIFRDKKAIQGKTTLYICHEGACLKPFTDEQDIEAALKRL